MGARTKYFKVGHFLRLRKYVIAPFKAVRQEHYEQNAASRQELGIADFDPNAPQYTFIRIDKIEPGTIFATNILSLESCAYRLEGSGRWVKFDPNGKTMFDFWGNDEVVCLTKKEASDLIRKRHEELLHKADKARQEVSAYEESTQKILAPNYCT